MRKGVYVVKSLNDVYLSPSEYGFNSVKWSFEIAVADFKVFSTLAKKGYRLSSSVVERGFPGLLNLAALYSAAYLNYGVWVVESQPVHCIRPIVEGIKQGVAITLMENIGLAESEAKELVGIFESMVAGYGETHRKDWFEYYVDETDTYRPDPSFTARLFLDNLESMYGSFSNPSDQIEKSNIGFNLIDENVINFYRVQKNDIGIDYI